MTELLAQAVDELRIGNTQGVKYKSVPTPIERPKKRSPEAQAAAPAPNAPAPEETAASRAVAVLKATRPRRRGGRS